MTQHPIKTVFIDYMGTTVDEHSVEMVEIVRRICKNSVLHDPKQVQRFILTIAAVMRRTAIWTAI